MQEHDVLVVGGGGAGLRAAIAADEVGADVAIVSKLHPVRSHTGAAEGGINAVLQEEDSVESHAYDTMKGSDYLADAPAVETLAEESPPNGRWETRPSSSREKGIPQCSTWMTSAGASLHRVSMAGASPR